MDKNDARIVTPECRFVYPHFFEPRQMMINGKPKGEPKYEVDLLLEPESLADLKTKAVQVARAKWPGRDFKANPVKFPFKNGDAIKAKQEAKGKKGLDYLAGKAVIHATSTYPVQVVDAQGNPILDKARVYGGCYGFAEITFAAYDGNGENIPDSVTTYINLAMKSRDGERIGGRDAKTVFAGVIGKQTQEDPTEGLDDEIPF